MSYNSRVIELVISNSPRATRSADLKLLARLLLELYSTQSNYRGLVVQKPVNAKLGLKVNRGSVSLIKNFGLQFESSES